MTTNYHALFFSFNVNCNVALTSYYGCSKVVVSFFALKKLTKVLITWPDVETTLKCDIAFTSYRATR